MQTDEILYSERQRFRQWWLWILVLPGPTFLLWAMVKQIGMDSLVGNNPVNDVGLIILGLGVGIGLPLFVYTMGLDTEVRRDGLYIRFKPFHRDWVVFEFMRIKKAELNIYNPLRDYGGWGIRYGSKGKAYNVSGNRGVLLTLDDGNNVLIGSSSHEILYSLVNKKLSLYDCQ